MQIEVTSGDLAAQDVDTVVVSLPEGSRRPGGAAGALNTASGGALHAMIASGAIRLSDGALAPVPVGDDIGARRAFVHGLGDRSKLNPGRTRSQAGALSRSLRGVDAGSVAIAAQPDWLGSDLERGAQAIAEGFTLGLYRFDQHHTREQDRPRGNVSSLLIVERSERRAARVRAGVERGQIMGEAQNLSRDLSNSPANLMTPTDMAARAQEIAEATGIECEIIEREEAERLGMGSYLSVAQGSDQPPKFIVLRYRGAPGRRSVALIGKGITFDSGGISIKPAGGMERMKADMSGAAAVLGAMQAIARLAPAINVTGIAPCTENLPNGSATKPGDVFYAMDGQSVEVINTDAEGRLVLADALGYARAHNCSPLIDVATLTGAMSIALGNVRTGVFVNNDRLFRDLDSAADDAGEPIWRFPLDDEYDNQIKSDVADIKNTGGRGAGSITAAKFLQRFAHDTPWAHFDIAGVMDNDRDRGEKVKGVAGTATRTLVEYVLARAG
ncbi:MAG: leucyl aminopeptidase [Chloroflexi bacterium]|nr:leucyl aminopeptidase [Chloroflexota bacterium]